MRVRSLLRLIRLSTICRLRKVNSLSETEEFSKNQRRKTYWAVMAADCCNTESIILSQFSFGDVKTTESRFDQTHPIEIFKPMKIVLCFFCDGVPLKFYIKKEEYGCIFFTQKYEICITKITKTSFGVLVLGSHSL